DRSRIFERFYRGERVRSLRGTSSAVSTGAGLGLPIARWIAEAHGGELQLEESGEGGSTFVATIPRGDTGAEVEQQPQRAESAV
ncbi:MAG TPA: sensor histidine kinase, partial [Thermoanaerobaculia bacterium]